MSEDARSPVAIRITRPYASSDELLQSELETFSRTGIILLGAQPRPEGVVLRFELMLKSGEMALRGEGRVVGYRPKAIGESPGLALRFTRLDTKSKSLVDRAASLKETRAKSGSGERPSAIPPSFTQVTPQPGGERAPSAPEGRVGSIPPPSAVGVLPPAGSMGVLPPAAANVDPETTYVDAPGAIEAEMPAVKPPSAPPRPPPLPAAARNGGSQRPRAPSPPPPPVPVSPAEAAPAARRAEEEARNIAARAELGRPPNEGPPPGAPLTRRSELLDRLRVRARGLDVATVEAITPRR